MKKAHHHAPPKKAAPKLPRQQKLLHAAAPKEAPKEKVKEKKLTAPIFNTSLAGMHYTYIRPFDPVWPTDPED